MEMLLLERDIFMTKQKIANISKLLFEILEMKEPKNY